MLHATYKRTALNKRYLGIPFTSASAVKMVDKMSTYSPLDAKVTKAEPMVGFMSTLQSIAPWADR